MQGQAPQQAPPPQQEPASAVEEEVSHNGKSRMGRH